jgi:hypothetical protein
MLNIIYSYISYIKLDIIESMLNIIYSYIPGAGGAAVWGHADIEKDPAGDRLGLLFLFCFVLLDVSLHRLP